MKTSSSGLDGKAPAYLLLSPEPLFLREAEKELLDAVMSSQGREMNYLAVYGWEADATDALEFLQTMPFLSDRKLLVIREFHTFGDWKELLGYLEDPNPFSCLLLTSSEVKRNDSSCKVISRHAPVIERRRPYGAGLARWVVNRFAFLGMEADEDIARTMIDIAGTGLMELTSEIEKVSLYAGDRKVIQQSDLKATVPGGVENIFSLLDSVGERDSSRSLHLLRVLTDSGIRPEFILHMIARHYRQLLRGKVMVSGGMTPQAAAKKLGIRFAGLQKKFTKQLGMVQRSELERGIRELSRCDLKLKTGRIPEDILLDDLLVQLLV